MEYTIYLRTNLVNGKQYVGQTNNFKRREYNWYNTNWSYAGKLINNARKKYGVDNFKTSILDVVKTQDESNEMETYYIKLFNTKTPNGYNLTDGGEGCSGYNISDEIKKRLSEVNKGENNPFYGRHHSKETIEKLKNRVITDEWRNKISEATKGRPSVFKGKHHTEEAKQKLREAHLGKKASEETKKKLSDKMKGSGNGMYGKHHSEEARKKMSENLKGKTSGEKNPMFGRKRNDIAELRGKKVYQYSLDKVLIKIWDSASDAARELGFNRGCIKDCCHRGRFQNYKGEKKWYNVRKYKGYIWSYKPL